MSEFGLGIFALGEIQRAETAAARANGAGAIAGAAVATNVGKAWEDHYNQYVFRAKSHVHGLRAIAYAHEHTEDQLIAALKAENANHPLASREAVDAAFEDERVRMLLDPEVIKRTYPDGKLPDGAVGGDPLGGRTIA